MYVTFVCICRVYRMKRKPSNARTTDLVFFFSFCSKLWFSYTIKCNKKWCNMHKLREVFSRKTYLSMGLFVLYTYKHRAAISLGIKFNFSLFQKMLILYGGFYFICWFVSFLFFVKRKKRIPDFETGSSSV